MDKNITRTSLSGVITEQTASICGVSDRYVRMVKKGDRNNEVVIEVYMTLWEGFNKVQSEVRKRYREALNSNANN